MRVCKHGDMSDVATHTSDGVRVRLLDFPVALFVAGEPQWQATLREYALRGLGGITQAYDAADVGRARAALDVVAVSVLSLPTGPPVDQVAGAALDLASAVPADFATLQAVLDDARRLSRTGELLTLPVVPEVVALRNWFCEQVAVQAAGEVPSPWRLASAGGVLTDSLPDWDETILPEGKVCWLVGDDHNRVVDASQDALELLGWERHQLIGQRLLAVIPHRFREAHLAAFTSNVLNDVSHILGTPVTLPALRADGSEVQIRLTLSRHPARQGRLVYLARFERL